MSERKYTAVQIPKTSKAHKQLKMVAKKLSQKMTEETGLTVNVTHYQALEYAVQLAVEKIQADK